jgi:leucyl-tRNA synthetase
MRRRANLGNRPFLKPGAEAEKVATARAMRRAPTRGEDVLWDALRDLRKGWKFRRQHVIAGYIVDFYCAHLRLAIEVDGPIHDARRGGDHQRDIHLRLLGLLVLRLREADVVTDLDHTLHLIARTCRARALALKPSTARGGGSGWGPFHQR